MKKFECKNGCSGEKGFHFEGNIWCAGDVDGDGNTYDGDQARFVEVTYYRCEECGGEWNVGKEEQFYV